MKVAVCHNLTGGGAKLHGIVDLAKKQFSLYASLGTFKDSLGIEDDLALSTVCGLALSGFDSLDIQDEGPGVLNLIGSWAKRGFKPPPAPVGAPGGS